MESINIALFNYLNAGAALAGPCLNLSIALAEYLILVVPALLVFLWFLKHSEQVRVGLLNSFYGAMLALGINQLIGLIYQHPRPFQAGLGHAYLRHAADSSFPSDHVTVLCAVGLSLLLERTTRREGVCLMLAALAVAWARVYLGVHFPLDMAGAMGTATLSVALIRIVAHSIDTLVNRPLLRFYARVILSRSAA
jgi:undecaprenyl-diphosphatase